MTIWYPISPATPLLALAGFESNLNHGVCCSQSVGKLGVLSRKQGLVMMFGVWIMGREWDRRAGWGEGGGVGEMVSRAATREDRDWRER